MKTFQQYREQSFLRNESIRDKMTPKSREDVINSLDFLMKKTARELQYMNTEGDVEGMEDFSDAYDFVRSHINTVMDLVSDYHYTDPEQIAFYLSVYLKST